MDGQLDGGSGAYAAAVASAHGCDAYPGGSYPGAHNGGVAVVAAAAASAAPGGAAALVPAEREVREAQRRLRRAETLLSKFPRYRANDYAVGPAVQQVEISGRARRSLELHVHQ